MLSANQKEVLSMIFGDDLEAIGDIVIVRDQEEGMFLVNNRGEKLLPGSCYGVGRFLGPRGFNYVVLTKEKAHKNSGYYGSQTTYTVNDYNDNFDWVAVFDTQAQGYGLYKKMGINLFGKFFDVRLNEDGILKEYGVPY